MSNVLSKSMELIITAGRETGTILGKALSCSGLIIMTHHTYLNTTASLLVDSTIKSFSLGYYYS